MPVHLLLTGSYQSQPCFNIITPNWYHMHPLNRSSSKRVLICKFSAFSALFFHSTKANFYVFPCLLCQLFSKIFNFRTCPYKALMGKSFFEFHSRASSSDFLIFFHTGTTDPIFLNSLTILLYFFSTDFLVVFW